MLKKAYTLILCAFVIMSCNNDDDLTIVACNQVTNVSSSDITNTSARVSWTDANAVGSYIIEFGPSGFALGTGTELSLTETSITLTGLVANTTYDVYVQTICSTTNVSMFTDVFSFTTLPPPVIPEFRPTLSELNIYQGDLSNLDPSPYAFEYNLSTKLFTDYATKQRLIALPNGEKMTYNGDGLPIFPDNSLIAKTFFYNNDETDLSLGINIIETRLLIKIDGSWISKTYKWNDTQTDATLDSEGAVVPVTWVDAEGESRSIDYEIPSETDCFVCHSNAGEGTPIGPKLRTMNFDFNGSNQLQALIDSEMIEGLSDPSVVNALPDWEDTSLGLERRARAYMDINCAHCHIQGGYCEEQSQLRLAYETGLEESYITQSSSSIIARIQNNIPEYGMPLIGTTIIHDEGVDMLIEYLNSLE